MLITGTSRGIGKYLVEYYLRLGVKVFGCSRQESDIDDKSYTHFCLDITEEKEVKKMFSNIKALSILINNAGTASMNFSLLTPLSTYKKIMDTNFLGTFLFCREASKIMIKKKYGRIVNFTSIARPLNLEGESIYAASKAAIETLTVILAKELGQLGVTVNAIGPTPIKTDLIRNIPQVKIDKLVDMQSIKRMSEFEDISNVIDFFISEKSDFITGQVIYLGGIS
jgi:3-oxoacyl-[acyl-carrier protein] reductase